MFDLALLGETEARREVGIAAAAKAFHGQDVVTPALLALVRGEGEEAVGCVEVAVFGVACTCTVGGKEGAGFAGDAGTAAATAWIGEHAFDVVFVLGAVCGFVTWETVPSNGAAVTVRTLKQDF